MNDTQNKKITILQALLIYIMAIYSPAIRYLTRITSIYAQQAAWLSIIASMFIFVPLMFILYKVTKKFEGQSLHDIFCRVFGKPLGKTICIFYIFWLFILLSLLIRYSGEKLISTVFTTTDINLLMFLLVAIVAIMLRWGIQVLSRMNKIILALTIVQFAIVLFFLFMHFKVEYITPVSTLDIKPVAQSMIYPLTIFVYITPLFIFNDQIQYGKKSFGGFVFTASFLTVALTLLMLAMLGMFTSQVIAKLNYPMYTAVENISIFSSSAGLESLFVSFWSITEYITIAFFAYCVTRLIKNVFNLKNQTPVLTAILGAGLVFAIFYKDSFELIEFSQTIISFVNLIFGLGIPFILFITAKARKLL
ncbi:MAG: GerAB/ArcD/ProY family transporter [Christensenellales bacterium]|jgi:spore germination protein (amino acid permease)